MSEVSECVAVHALNKLFPVIKYHVFFEFFLVAAVKLVFADDKLELSAEGHVEAFTAWVDNLIEFDSSAIYTHIGQVLQVCFELLALLFWPALGQLFFLNI